MAVSYTHLGWGGHGNFIIIGGETPADVKRAVELALEYIDINAGEIYISEAVSYTHLPDSTAFVTSSISKSSLPLSLS